MSSYSQHFKASLGTPGLLWDLLGNWMWLFSNTNGNYVVLFGFGKRMCFGNIHKSRVLDMTPEENESSTLPTGPRRIH